ncbi:hypothetical protein [Chitinophaga ginsengisegetis]|uniref:hypothetical protein n=1 Tax=Chitinophaga ginsengisegetis TaxID=393003 RepID=UPI000DB991F9|nr:hypothetical protein [Chitinophaga ginsengisegetis]MDR6569935.1 hypothetical protein [Chitinophaga ginsengisegetis]MDR6649668.1 hypothetical protein [Chitinophaga ginsengisegetis]MDR6656129.1 hypothetical protein [Chitinophaga ginsengisegetis]
MNKEINVLNKLHAAFTTMPIRFRERVCEECNYSNPTFYRKVRGVNTVENRKVIQVLSNAEKAKIREVAEEVRHELDSLVSHLINPK